MTSPESPHFPGRSRRAVLGVLAGLATAVLAVLDLRSSDPRYAWTFVGIIVLAVALLLRRWSREALPFFVPPGLRRPRLKDVFRHSLALGATGFGGGLSVLSQIEQRLVERERWVPARRFLEATAIAQSLPGAVATNALALIGLWVAGVEGALAAVLGFILPSFVMLLVFGIAYRGLHDQIAVEGAFRGLNPAVAGLVLATAMRLGARVALTPDGTPGGWRALWHDRFSLGLMLGSGVAVAVLRIGVVETTLLAGLAGLLRAALLRVPESGAFFDARWRWLQRRVIGAIRAGVGALSVPWWRRWRSRDEDDLMALAPLWILAGPFAPAALDRVAALGELTGVFLRAGAVTFGGGFVMIPLLEAELVRAHHWLTPRAFADAMALGQITPGPVVITATFVGYSVAGIAGAVLATISVFLPALLMTIVIGTSVERFRKSEALQAFLRGVQPAVVGLMFAAAWSLAQHGIRQWPGIVIAVLAFLLIWRGRITPVRILLGASAIGIVWGLARP